MVCQNRTELQQNFYQIFSNDQRDSEYLSKRALMASINVIIDLGNQQMLHQVRGNLKKYLQC